MIEKKKVEPVPQKLKEPPKNNMVFNADINNILLYSPNENKANCIPEYSTLYPETNSDSASGRSNGCLFVSASEVIKKINHKGAKGTINQISF